MSQKRQRVCRKKDNIIYKYKIDRFFLYIIKKEKENPEDISKSDEIEFRNILEKLGFNYEEKHLSIFTNENIEKIKIIVYALKEIFLSGKRNLINKLERNNLFYIYDRCQKKQLEYKNTDNEIKNFFEYYYTSLIKDLEKL